MNGSRCGIDRIILGFFDILSTADDTPRGAKWIESLWGIIGISNERDAVVDKDFESAEPPGTGVMENPILFVNCCEMTVKCSVLELMALVVVYRHWSL